MARTRTQLRQLVVQQLGLPFISGTADGSGGSTTSLVDLPDLAQFRDDALIGSWVFVSDGSPNFRDLQITDSGQAAGSVTYIPALSAAPNSRTYEILPFSATAIHQAIDGALTALFDSGVLVREFWLRNIVVGSPIYNASFDLWSTTTAVDGWTGAAAGVTQSRERDNINVALSEQAMGLTSNSSTEGRLQLDVPWRRFLWDMKGRTLNFHCWVRSGTASHARIGISNGTSLTYSGYHSGDGDWNLLNVEYSSLRSDTDLIPSLVVASSSATSYFADCWISGGGEIFEYPWPIVLAPDGPSLVHHAAQDVDTSNSLGTLRQLGPYRASTEFQFFKSHDFAFPSATSLQRGILTLPRGLPDGDRLRAMCSGPFTLPDAEADTIEVTLPESDLVAKVAAKILLERRMLSMPLATRRVYAERIRLLEEAIQDLSGGHGQASDVVAFGPVW